MHRHESAGRTAAGGGPARTGTSAPALTPQQRGLLGLQTGAGNAAVVQFLRRNAHPWADEEHQHSGHEGSRPVQRSAVRDVRHRLVPSSASAAVFSVQRAYDRDNPANPQNVLTTEHWERQAGLRDADGKSSKEASKATADLRAAATKNTKSKAGEARPMGDVVAKEGPKLLKALAAKPETSGRLELYRAMSYEEAESILAYWGSPAQLAALDYVAAGGGSAQEFKRSHSGMTIGAHLGDRGQAEVYHNKLGEKYAVMLRFTLKPGAHELLFHPDHMALGPGHKTDLIRKGTGGEYRNGTGNEGKLSGYIGIKAEKNEPYSLTIAQGSNTGQRREAGPSQLLFQLFVQSVSLVGNKSGKPLAG